MLRKINIKENFPDAKYAVIQLENEIRYAKMEGINVLIVIHGYGSHGIGGTIKTESIKLLTQLRNQEKIINFVGGENFCDTNEDKRTICENFPELILDKNLQNLNAGVTVVWVK